MRVVRAFCCAVVLGLMSQPVAAAPITIDFEDLFEFDDVGTQYAGVTFSNAQVLTAGSLLNEIEFPPASGVNVASPFDLPLIELQFDTPIAFFQALLTYDGSVVVVEGFGPGNTLVDSASSLFDSNVATGPNPPNEAITISGAGITRVRISAWGGFTIDDVTYEARTVVPEPTSAALLAAGALAGALRRRRRA